MASMAAFIGKALRTSLGLRMSIEIGRERLGFILPPGDARGHARGVPVLLPALSIRGRGLPGHRRGNIK
jgi:hypothetical protein